MRKSCFYNKSVPNHRIATTVNILGQTAAAATEETETPLPVSHACCTRGKALCFVDPPSCCSVHHRLFKMIYFFLAMQNEMVV